MKDLDRQYVLTLKAIRDFEEGIYLAEHTPIDPLVDPLYATHMIDGLKSQLDELRQQAREHERTLRLRSHQPRSRFKELLTK